MRYDIAVVITTVCRDSLLRSVRSIFGQNYGGRIQIMIGIDCDPQNQFSRIQTILDDERPDNVKTTWLNLGYSTSRRHGGPHSCFYGGSLRSALTLLADAEYVMYLDDDDWLDPGHCLSITNCITGNKWAFSYCFYADGDTGEALCVDKIESVGVGRGVYEAKFGGFVRPSGMTINKLELLHLVHLWSCSPYLSGDGEDRLIFDALRNEPHACTGEATVFHTIDPKDSMHPVRMEFMKSQGVARIPSMKRNSIR
jgi:hypothetical protein